ncbi:MAG: hypothetical protein D6698_06380 [Gammaproteobacteria bacterium]|nr:MAG: hypothetical protein D6698_06380 [Gammaproteobacteria bacterium]
MTKAEFCVDPDKGVYINFAEAIKGYEDDNLFVTYARMKAKEYADYVMSVCKDVGSIDKFATKEYTFVVRPVKVQIED